MKKILLFFVVFVGITCSNNTVQAQTLSFDRPLIWGASPFQDSLWALDTTNWSIPYRLAPSLVGFTITGINGLATDPTTGVTYCIMKLSAVSGRVLGTIDLATAVCTQVGNLGDNFSSISFREDGQLFGVTGDGATVPETLYLIDKTNGNKTVATALGNGLDGEVICHDPDSNVFYHWSGNGTVVMEKILDQAPYTVTGIPISGTTGGETFGAMFNGAGKLIISNISSALKRLSTAGVYDAANLSSNPDDLRGVVMLPYFTVIDDTICVNETMMVNGGGHALFTDYIFHWGDGNFDTVATADGVITMGSHIYSAGGSYIIHVESYNGFGGDTVFSYTVQVNNVPIVTLSGFSTVCSGDSITLTGSSGGTSQWYMNGVLIPGATTNTYSTDQPGIYNMIKTNLNGCSDSAAVGATVVLSNYPVVNLGNDTAACSSHTVDAGNAGSSYQWSTGDTTQMYTATASLNLTVTVTNNDGCASTDSISMTINTPPAVNLGPDTTACGSVVVDAGSFPGGTYLWCTGATTQMVTFTTSGTCTVMVADTNGCVGMDTVTVTVNPNPIVNLGPDVAACTMVVVTADSTLAGGSFLWCDNSTAMNVIITNSTTCDLTYTDINGCVGYDTINITIYGNPLVTASASSTSVCAADADVVLSGTPVGGAFTGTSVSGNNFDPSIGAGTYQVIYSYTDANGCSGSDTVAITVSACVGITENPAGEFSLFPNPSTGIVNINLTEAGSTIEVLDVLGNVVAMKKTTTAGTTQLDLSAQPNGVYFLRVNNENAKRIIIQR